MNVASFRKKLNFALADRPLYVVVDGKRYEVKDVEANKVFDEEVIDVVVGDAAQVAAVGESPEERIPA